ncbi:hypothetical protein EYF80_014970 [Liparis tanakae]|uniref:Uncharacterized protein n=1 Tax=Liparis tanakae TaxID=230148 RepID=A0A4Z2IAG6_9TELE|nr:hypothetical protein EYF80_014970 [Liparis tanakae]
MSSGRFLHLAPLPTSLTLSTSVAHPSHPDPLGAFKLGESSERFLTGAYIRKHFTLTCRTEEEEKQWCTAMG